MAKTPEHAMQLMEQVWKPAVGRVHQEVADMQAMADKKAQRSRSSRGIIVICGEGPQSPLRTGP
jgi:Zn-dependent oligopeptidase